MLDHVPDRKIWTPKKTEVSKVSLRYTTWRLAHFFRYFSIVGLEVDNIGQPLGKIILRIVSGSVGNCVA